MVLVYLVPAACLHPVCETTRGAKRKTAPQGSLATFKQGAQSSSLLRPAGGGTHRPAQPLEVAVD